MDVGVDVTHGWKLDVCQGSDGMMHLNMWESETGRLVVSVKQHMDNPLTLDRVADELIAIAPWVRLQDNTKEFK